jgi:hypothetical protein
LDYQEGIAGMSEYVDFFPFPLGAPPAVTISGGGSVEIPDTKQWIEDANQRNDTFIFTYPDRTETWTIVWNAETGDVISSNKVVT